jgi:2-C-methyl-D-erythritol 4-phosphate cytidylyltransferase
MNTTIAILLAAGKSERFGGNLPKPFLNLNGKSIYRYSLDVFLSNPKIDAVLLVVPQEFLSEERARLEKEIFPKPILVIAGGVSRFDSVHKALHQLDKSTKKIIIHDAARPFVTHKIIDDCLQKLSQNKAVSCSIKTTDTLVIRELNGKVNSYPDRTNTEHIQTPQAFDALLLKTTYSIAIKEGKTDFTDDSSLIHHFHLDSVMLVEGDPSNIKITYPSDLVFAEYYLQKRSL